MNAMATRRATLATFAPTPIVTPPPEDAVVEAVSAEPEQPSRPALAKQPRPAPQESRRKYPHVSVYLPADTIRTLKLIAIEHGTRVNELCAEAINAWLETNGHARGKRFKV
jgi:hypothetical protein